MPKQVVRSRFEIDCKIAFLDCDSSADFAGEDVSSEEESESSDSAESEDEISQKPGNTPKLKKFDIPNLKQLEPVSSLQGIQFALKNMKMKPECCLPIYDVLVNTMGVSKL